MNSFDIIISKLGEISQEVNFINERITFLRNSLYFGIFLIMIGLLLVAVIANSKKRRLGISSPLLYRHILYFSSCTSQSHLSSEL